MKTNETTMNADSPTPTAIPPAAPVTAPPPAAAPVVAAAAPPPVLPANPVAAKPRKGGRKSKAPALTPKP